MKIPMKFSNIASMRISMKIPMKPSNFPEYENSYEIFTYLEDDGSHGTTTKIFIFFFFKYSDYETFGSTFQILCFWEFL